MISVKAMLQSIYGIKQFPAIIPYRGVHLIPNPKRVDPNGVDSNGDPRAATWVLKPLKVGAGKAYLISKLLNEKTLRQLTPALIQLEPGSFYLWTGGNRYQLTQYLEGAEADYYQLNDLQSAIRSMALFHQLTHQLITDNCPTDTCPAHSCATQTYPTCNRARARESSWALLNYNLIQEWRHRLMELETCRAIALRQQRTESFHSCSHDLAKKYLQIWPECYNQAFQAYKELINLDYKSNTYRSICYHDWAHHNLIIKDGTAYLIDFDYMIIDHPVHDRANLTGHYLRLHQWSSQALDTILLCYARDYPFRSDELNLLRLFLLFPYDFWILGRQYFIEKQPWSLKYYQDQWERKITLYKQRTRLLESMKHLV